MKRQSTKTVMLVLVAAAVIVSLSACGNKVQPLQSNGSANNQNQAVSDNGSSNDNATANEGQTNAGSNAADAVTAGSSDKAGSTGDGTGKNTGGSADGTDTKPAAPEQKKEEISVYYTDDQMIDLHAQKAEIAYDDEVGKLTAAFEALQKDGAKGETSLWKKVKLLSVIQAGDAVTIDVHLPDEARLGAPGEQLAIGAITQTYFQFKDVASLDILVDGEAVDSLMGHGDLEHPIKKQ
ncbi:GerMN domain-containing protein [Paenibacillus rhizovicinus]|uniref:GerMN domain-containing protein n=1 Tax=Paenibacillus rhizovicinus TaxID=2704463 RepID=A0A6C0P746_9BACL|nr:GerMN domain-containing protein [Paenibacillus rhizovicinus]QHW34430.1 GerMN domain-containing protein [Paenibacillus rhizovicinus]